MTSIWFVSALQCGAQLPAGTCMSDPPPPPPPPLQLANLDQQCAPPYSNNTCLLMDNALFLAKLCTLPSCRVWFPVPTIKQKRD